MLTLKDILDEVEKIISSNQDGWDAVAEIKDFLVKQKPPEADGMEDWEEHEISCDCEECFFKE